jgi:hypothetical protein
MRQHDPHISARKQVRTKYRCSSHGYQLTDEEFDRITAEPCFYCDEPPGNEAFYDKGKDRGIFVYSGIDRLDSFRGYAPDNVVPCCRACNYGKLDGTPEAYLAHCAQVVAHHASVHYDDYLGIYVLDKPAKT